MKDIKNVCLYYRVSTEDQVGKDTIENQKDLLPKWAKEQGWNVVAEFEDPGLTGTRMEMRPEFLEMLRRVKANEFDAVGVRHSDRLTRTEDLEEWGLIYGAFQKSKTLIVSPYEGVMDMEDLSGQMMAFIRGRISAEESKKTKQRQKEGIARKHRLGHYASGHIPFGISWDKTSTKWLRNESEFSVLQEMVRLLKAGAGVKKIATTFNADLSRFPTRRFIQMQNPNYKPAVKANRKRKPKSEFWAPGTIWTIANNDFLHTGIITTKAGTIDTGIRLFSKDDIRQARHFMKQRTRKVSKKMKAVPNRFLLRRLIKCGTCGIYLSISEPRNIYKCSKCGMELRNAGKVDDRIWNHLIDTFSDPDKLADAVKSQEFIPDRTLADLRQDQKTTEKKLSGISQGKERLNEMYALDTRMTRDQYDKLYLSLDKREKEMENVLGRITKTLARSEDMDAAIRNASVFIADQLMWASKEDDQTRQDEFSSATVVARDKTGQSAAQLFEQKKEMLNKLLLADGEILAWKDRIKITGSLLKDICNIDRDFNLCSVHPVE